MSEMRIAVALLRNASGHILLVRKRGTAAFMQPGGKVEPGEDGDAALAREVREELGLEIDRAALCHLGQARAPAANEPGITVVAEIFDLPSSDQPIAVQAEIAEALWLDPAMSHDVPLAPLTRDHIVPLAASLLCLPSSRGV